ncbi:hypothetical protein Tco_1005941 [Tanacetum coccineum]|uniref:Uncharacterized protein n=1 Tax=Tanacetum coccineum TaxID=301880 RepID=A0ABQ5FH85_9ASTR
MNGQPFTLDFNTFCSSIGFDYNKGKYIAYPTPKTVKTTLGKISTNASYLDKTPVMKNSFPVAWRILFTFVIQVLDENYLSTEQINSIQQMIAYCLITGTEVDIGEIIYSDLDPSKVTRIELTPYMIAVNNQNDSVSPLPLSGKKKKVKSQTMTPTLPKSQGHEASESLPQRRKKPNTPRPKGSLADKDLEGNKPPTDMELINPTIVDPSGTDAEYQPDHETVQLNTLADIQAYLLSKDELAHESDEEEVFVAGDDMEEENQADEEEHLSHP